MCSAPVDDKNTVRFGIACCQHDSILCIPGIRPFILHKKNPPSGGTSHRASGYLTHVARSAQRHAQSQTSLFQERTKKSAVRRNIPPRERLPHACCAFSATICATASQGKSGAISHRVKKTPPSGGTSRRDSGYLTHIARSAQRYAQSQRLGLRTAPFRIGGCIARQGRRQIEATPKDPSSLKLRRDKVYLLDCLSRRNVMQPEGGVR